MKDVYVHPTAIVDDGAELGEGTKVWHFVHVCSGAKVGRRCILGQNVFVARGVKLGDGVKVQNNVSIYEGVELEDDVFLGPSCVFTNVNNPRAFVERKAEYRATRVKKGASIGANATIVCGHDIGEYAFIGAGAVVTKHVPAHALMVGNPARRIGWMSRAGERLPAGSRPVCAKTGERYVVDGETCRVATPADEVAPSSRPIPLLDLTAHHAPLLSEFRAAFERVMQSGHFILGEECTAFEAQCAKLLGVPHALGVSSGTDGLLLAMMAMGIGAGDEVVTTPFSFFATAGCVVRLGARPVFVDIDPKTFNISVPGIAKAITQRTKAIMPVHLFGQPSAMAEIRAIAEPRGIPVIEDAAQALGASTADGRVGDLGTVASFSFFPSKNVGAFGDGGLVTTRDASLAERMRLLRHHGMQPKYFHTVVGGNFRLDALQAALLRVKIPFTDTWAAARRANAKLYGQLFAEAALPTSQLVLPQAVEAGHVWNQYVIRTPRRDALRQHLTAKGISTEVYYPRGLHVQPALGWLGYAEGSMPETEKACREVLALPIFPELGEERLRRVAREVLAFLRA